MIGLILPTAKKISKLYMQNLGREKLMVSLHNCLIKATHLQGLKLMTSFWQTN